MESLFPEIDIENVTPFLKQFFVEKKKYPDSILFFRMGDFYETFYDDAEKVSEITGIALTTKPAGKDMRIPLAGVPVKAVEKYVNLLLESGCKIAICEQLEPAGGKLIKREVVDVITPGTTTEYGHLNPKNSLYICCVIIEKKNCGIAFSEVASGEFYAGNIPFNNLSKELEFISPKEIISNRKDIIDSSVSLMSEIDNTYYSKASYAKFLDHLGVINLNGFGIDDESAASKAATALFEYLTNIIKKNLNHIKKIKIYDVKKFMVIDNITIKNLEIISSTKGDKNFSLSDTLDFTNLSSGSRCLKRWLKHPLINKNQIEERQKAVEFFCKNQNISKKIDIYFKGLIDPLRLSGRLGTKKITVTELVKFKKVLDILPYIREIALNSNSNLLNRNGEKIDIQKNIVELLEKSIEEDSTKGVIKEGYNLELDKVKINVNNALLEISKIENTEKERLQINSLKLKYNLVIGYYIEITRPNLHLVPDNYKRKQWLTNAERFTTERLTELQNIILLGQEKIKKLEEELLNKIRGICSEFSSITFENGVLLSEIDVINSFAKAAVKYNYIKPTIEDSEILEVIESRHPVIEKKNIKERFIPNDINLDKNISMAVITGPNMSGKSTYLRQTALMVIMAQTGTFIPAKSARIGIVDKIFSRVGASDDISKGISTYMAEMIETAYILNNITKRSFVILDEIGRGTSTFDGISIAWSVAEYIYEIGTKTMFATHYHELAELSNKHSGIVNLNVAVAKTKKKIKFLRKVVKGSSSHSYGIEVAKLAGLPLEVIIKSEKVLRSLENTDVKLPIEEREKENIQLSLFTHPVIDELRKMKIDKMTPLDAINILNELKKMSFEDL